jgi:hypothetical protein
MSAPQLIHHGQNVKPHYAPAPGQTESWIGKSTDEDRPDGNTNGIVRRYGKLTQASDRTISSGLISRVGSDAIRYSTPTEIGLRGLAMVSGVVSLGVVAFLVSMALDVIGWGDWFAIVSGSIMLVGSVLAGSTTFLWSARLELFQPIDQPTIFDRKHRKVYRIFGEAQPGWTGLFKRWPLRACEYD